MDAKTIIAIVLVAFIVGAAIWLNIRNSSIKRDKAGAGFVYLLPFPFPIRRWSFYRNAKEIWHHLCRPTVALSAEKPFRGCGTPLQHDERGGNLSA